MGEAPRRVQLSRAKGWRMSENTVKVDRSTGFGNPFPITKCTSTHMGVTKPIFQIGTWAGPAMWLRDTKAEAQQISVSAYRAWLNQPAQHPLRDRIAMLRGKNLACWCRLDAPCHADVLLELANRPENPHD